MEKMLIGGQLVAGDSEIGVVNPATRKIVASCAAASPCQLDQAVAAAADSGRAWADTPISERARVVAAIADRIREHRESLAAALVAEQGKTLAEAKGEIAGMAAFFKHVSRMEIPEERWDEPGRRSATISREPLGVVGAIVPWNFPALLIAFKVPGALLAGNSIVLKSSPSTPLTAARFAAIVQDLVPAGVLNVLGDAGELGPAMTAHPGIAKISFTGSTETGRRVMAGAATSLKRLTLELGGNDAGLVLEDADVDAVAPLIFRAAMMNAGQVCVAIKRLYVHDGLYDRLCDALAAIADRAVIGDGMAPETTMGPVQNEAQFARASAYLDHAARDGKIITSGQRASNLPGYFVRPTIVRDIDDGSALVDQEQFTPILPVIRVKDTQDGIERANRGAFGLGASVWSGDAQRARKVAASLRAGAVWIGKHGDLSPALPLAGVGSSGFGAELGVDGLKEFTRIKVIDGPAE